MLRPSPTSRITFFATPWDGRWPRSPRSPWPPRATGPDAARARASTAAPPPASSRRAFVVLIVLRLPVELRRSSRCVASPWTGPSRRYADRRRVHVGPGHAPSRRVGGARQDGAVPYVVLLDHTTRTDVVVLQDVDDDGAPGASRTVTTDDLPAVVAEREATERPRWVLDDTARRYPPLLAAGVRVERCHDLRLCHAILRRSLLTRGTALAAAPAGPWDEGT